MGSFEMGQSNKMTQTTLHELVHAAQICRVSGGDELRAAKIKMCGIGVDLALSGAVSEERRRLIHCSMVANAAKSSGWKSPD